MMGGLTEARAIVKPRSLIDAPFVQVPARVAAFLESRLPLTELRVKVRCQDPMVHDVLWALRVLAVSYVEGDESANGAAGSGAGTTVAPPPEPSECSMTVKDVVGFVGVSDRAVRRAADDGRLRGVKDQLGWWNFQRADVAMWTASRTHRSSA